jgi:translation initiation factor 2 alpha subunit (eIF-2alpha)
MRHVAEKTNVPLEELYTNIGWPLYRKYGHAYDAFKIAISYLSFPSLLTLDNRTMSFLA